MTNTSVGWPQSAQSPRLCRVRFPNYQWAAFGACLEAQGSFGKALGARVAVHRHVKALTAASQVKPVCVPAKSLSQSPPTALQTLIVDSCGGDAGKCQLPCFTDPLHNPS